VQKNCTIRAMTTHNQTAPATAKDLADLLGRQNICTALGVGKSVVQQAVAENKFPARWFVALREMGKRSGVEVPEALFYWREADLPPERADA
jgi:hypothetical protein